MLENELFKDEDQDPSKEYIKKQILVWQKLDVAANDKQCISPSREGHNAVLYNRCMYIFGGLESNQLCNTLLKFDIKQKIWSLVTTAGDIPSPRRYQAAILVENFMILHGGQVKTQTETKTKYAPSDEMFVLDLLTYTWYLLPQSLSPLPAFGHTLTRSKVKINSSEVDCLLQFGGYCPSSKQYYNTMYACEVDDVILLMRSLTAGSASRELLPIRWRSLRCLGKPPSGRYRHSAALVHSQGSNAVLLIFGGITKSLHSKSGKAANDLYMLDLATLSWIAPKFGSDALVHMLNGNGPAPVYGHVAMPFVADVGSGRCDMIIFGGSSNTLQTSTACQHGLFVFNTQEHSWSKADTGYLFPPERCGHSVCICSDWSPLYNFPFTGVSAARTQVEQTKATSTLRTTAIIFGGISCIERQPDIWCLDITPDRPAGVNQFDYSIANLIQQELTKSKEEVSGLTTSQLRSHATTRVHPALHPVKITTKIAEPERFEPQMSFITPPVSKISPVMPTKRTNDINPNMESAGQPLKGILSQVKDGALPGVSKLIRGQSSRGIAQMPLGSLLHIPELTNECMDVDVDSPKGSSVPSLLKSGSERSIGSNSTEAELVRVTSTSNLFEEADIAKFNKFPQYSSQDLTQPHPKKIDQRREFKSQSLADLHASNDSAAFLKYRIQRALADLHTQHERSQAEDAETRCDSLEADIESIRQQLAAESESRIEEEITLQRAIDESRERVRLLTLLNIEATRLQKLCLAI